MNRNQIVALILALVFLFTSIPAFADTQTKLTVVTTIFPQYDFVRAIAGDTGAVNLTMAKRATIARCSSVVSMVKRNNLPTPSFSLAVS